MIEGFVLMIVGAVLLALAPIATARSGAAARGDAEPVAAALAVAFPIAAPPEDIEALTELADAALEADALIRGVGYTAGTYDRA